MTPILQQAVAQAYAPRSWSRAASGSWHRADPWPIPAVRSRALSTQLSRDVSLSRSGHSLSHLSE